MQCQESKEKSLLLRGRAAESERRRRDCWRKGAHVVVGARRTDRLEALVSDIRAEGGSAQYRALDVTKREDVEAFVNFAQSEFGKVDVVINNAGVMQLSPQ